MCSRHKSWNVPGKFFIDSQLLRCDCSHLFMESKILFYNEAISLSQTCCTSTKVLMWLAVSQNLSEQRNHAYVSSLIKES